MNEHLSFKDILILTQVAYKSLREVGDVLQVPMRDADSELLRDETMKLIKATYLAHKKYEQLTTK